MARVCTHIEERDGLTLLAFSTLKVEGRGTVKGKIGVWEPQGEDPLCVTTDQSSGKIEPPPRLV